ncbi:MCE family protein, partial [Myxococcota bacterium]|nr:MCE family protein [Myxococcota bacterium]
MNSSPYQALTGSITILLFLGFIAWVFFMGDVTLTSGLEFSVEFNRLGIIETGAPVRIGDQKVGFVKSINYVRSEAGAKPKVRLRLWIDKKYSSWIFTN